MDSPRNIYRDEVDFGQLALQDKEFNKFLKGNGQVNFGDPEVVKQLTLSLLRRDFSLILTLPQNRLCPPVPNRLNYILWLQDLISETAPIPFNTSIATSTPRTITGIDIGTGASAIYPLLGCRSTPHPPNSTYRFIATDIDPLNLSSARTNITTNNLASRIHLVPRTSFDALIPLDVLDKVGISRADFLMCNPPFYKGKEELIESAAAKSRPPFSACTGAEIEMCCDGGEVGFVGRILEESARPGVRGRVMWFSSMLGKLSSVGVIVEGLKKQGCVNWCVTEFVQGGRTRRWAVAWNWGAWRPGVRVARGVGEVARGTLGKGVLVFPSEFEMVVDGKGEKDGKGMKLQGEKVDGLMQGLEIWWRWNVSDATGTGFAWANVWSRSARRKKKMKEVRRETQDQDEMDEDGDENEDREEEKEPALGFRISVSEKKKDKDEVEVLIRWLFGRDAVLFESFCGMVRRSLGEG